jgi:retinol dehydrogenase 13
MKLPEELQFIQNDRMVQKITNARMDGRVCVVTGATSGVGYQVARRLARGGASLVLVCRNLEKAQAVKSELEENKMIKVEVIQADFSRLEDVRQAAEAILEQYPRLYALINNAGLHNTHRVLSDNGVEMVFQVNHLASFLFTRLLLPRIIESAPGRIIQVNSEGHRFGGLDLDDLDWNRRRYRGLQGYGASKTAQLLTVWELAERLKGTGVTINAVHPGNVRTMIGLNNGRLYQWYQRTLIWPLLKDPVISGEAIYYLAAAPEMEGVSGKFFNLTIEEKPARHALDLASRKRVWEISEQLTGLASKTEKRQAISKITDISTLEKAL